jgi:predicted permease
MTIVDEIRFAFRSLGARPGFLVAALATLGVAIGANIAVFTLANAMMLRPLPFGDRSDRIVSVHAAHAADAEDWHDARLSYADLRDLRAAAILEDAGGFVERNFTLQDGDTERITGGSITPNLFPLLGVGPAQGRPFRDTEAVSPGLESVVIITHGLWQRKFGGRVDILGKSILINHRALTVIGIMPQGFAFPERSELYLPLRWDDAPRTQRTVATFGLLKEGQTVEQAQRQLDAFAARLSRTYPATHERWSMRVMTFRDLMVDGDQRRLTTMLLIAVGFVLLIGCANLAGLLLARGEARRRDFAVRAALGATRWQMARSAFIESAVIAALGTCAGVLVAVWTLEMAPYAFADGLPYWVELAPDMRVAGFTLVMMAVTALGLGVAPGLRFSHPDLNGELKSSVGGTATGGILRLRGALVVTQVALSVALVSAAVLMVQSVVALQHAESGFDETRLLTFRTYAAGNHLDAVPARASALAALVNELRRTPGVMHAALTTSIPTDDGGVPLQIVPGGRWVRGRDLGAQQVAISPDLFATLGVPLHGRSFTDEEFTNPRAEAVIVSRAAAQRLWPGEGALGRQLDIVSGDRLERRRVVGVAGDVVYEEIGEQTPQSQLIVYVPYARAPLRTMAVMLRTSTTPQEAIATVRRVMRDRVGGLPAYDLRTMAQVRSYTTWEERVFGEMMAAFAIVAIGLAWLGVHGLVAYAVARRSREIGVRMALGAQRADVVRMIVSDMGVLAVAGLSVGLMLGRALTAALEGLTYGVDAADPRLLLAAAATMALAMVVAACWPAYRATRIQPVIALRSD